MDLSAARFRSEAKRCRDLAESATGQQRDELLQTAHDLDEEADEMDGVGPQSK
jgi:hypothetical protein